MDNYKYNKITILFVYFSMIYLILAPVFLDILFQKETKTEIVAIEKEDASMSVSKVEYVPEEKEEIREENNPVKHILNYYNSKALTGNTFTESMEEVIETKQEIVDEIKSEQIEIQKTFSDTYVDIAIPLTTGFKSYMSYKAITKKNSPQYMLQQNCTTDELGLRKFGNRYVIAVGTGVGGHVGTNVDLILENGVAIPCVIGEYKAAIHTDATNLISGNGCVSEFLVDQSALYGPAKSSGNISACNPLWASRVVTIRRY